MLGLRQDRESIGNRNMKTDIISRMEEAQQRFGRLQLEDRKFPSLLQSAEDERRADLRYESIMADESEYGPRQNERNDEGWA